jgi:hypothetical protein
MTAKSQIELSLSCFNPPFNLVFSGEGVFPGQQGQGTTQKIQFNVKTPSTSPQVLYVSYEPRNDAFCTITVPLGHRVIAGWFNPDWADVYTRHENDANSEVFPRDEIIKQVLISSEIATRTITFRVKAKQSTVKGTMNGTFTVKYEVAT